MSGSSRLPGPPGRPGWRSGRCRGSRRNESRPPPGAARHLREPRPPPGGGEVVGRAGWRAVGARPRLCTMKSRPSKRLQTTVAKPSGAHRDLRLGRVLTRGREGPGARLGAPCRIDTAALDDEGGPVEALPHHRRRAVRAEGELRLRRVPARRREVVGRSEGAAAEIRRSCTIVLDPFERTQTTVAVPSGATTTCGCTAFCPAAERSTAASRRAVRRDPPFLDDRVGAVIAAPDGGRRAVVGHRDLRVDRVFAGGREVLAFRRAGRPRRCGAL